MRYKVMEGPFERPNRRKYPFLDLEVGQAFFVPCTQKRRRKTQQTLSQCGIRWRKLGKGIYGTTLVEGGVRVERLA